MIIMMGVPSLKMVSGGVRRFSQMSRSVSPRPLRSKRDPLMMMTTMIRNNNSHNNNSNNNMMMRGGGVSLTQRSLSTEISSRLYENNGNSFDHQNGQPQPSPQEWSTYDGKLPILTEPENNKVHAGVLGIDGDVPRTSVLMELSDRVGVLHDVLRYFWKYDVNICRIESRPAKQASPTGQQKAFDFFVDMEGSPSDDNVGKLLDALRYVRRVVTFCFGGTVSDIFCVSGCTQCISFLICSPMTDKLLILDEKKVHCEFTKDLFVVSDCSLDMYFFLQAIICRVSSTH